MIDENNNNGDSTRKTKTTKPCLLHIICDMQLFKFTQPHNYPNNPHTESAEVVQAA